MTVLDDKAWSRCWDDFKKSAWRMEVQQTYTIPGEDFAQFLAGEPEPQGHNDRWHDQIRRWAAVGKSINRVRLVRYPLSDYQRYIFSWGVPGNVAAGEDVRVLDVTSDDFGIPDQDFWIFDDSTVVHLNFNPDGTLINHEQIDEPDIAKYRGWQETALKYSVPFSEWNART
jgi:uncharacterized protein DUF6879